MAHVRVDAPDDQGARGEPRPRPHLGAHDVVRRPGRRPVLALVRAARPLRAQRGPAPPPRVEEVEPGLAGVRRGRHLARDLQGARGRVRGDLRQHAAPRPRDRHRTCAGHGEGALGGAPDRRDGRRTCPPSPIPATDAGTSAAPGPASAGCRTSAPRRCRGGRAGAPWRPRGSRRSGSRGRTRPSGLEGGHHAADEAPAAEEGEQDEPEVDVFGHGAKRTVWR